jgi:hypothetical protein
MGFRTIFCQQDVKQRVLLKPIIIIMPLSERGQAQTVEKAAISLLTHPMVQILDETFDGWEQQILASPHGVVKISVEPSELEKLRVKLDIRRLRHTGPSFPGHQRTVNNMPEVGLSRASGQRLHARVEPPKTGGLPTEYDYIERPSGFDISVARGSQHMRFVEHRAGIDIHLKRLTNLLGMNAYGRISLVELPTGNSAAAKATASSR